ncbi:MAG: hypothetical protein KY456_16540 [Chloroflexi bacterium]|nr:hypothetical protein [Chloroflexota bacterium]
MRGVSILVLVVSLFATSLIVPMGPVAHAQEDMTTADLPITPGPELCLVEPRPLEFFEQYVGTPDATPSDAGSEEFEGSLESFVPPAGQPAEPETVDAVVATAVEIVACFNGGDLPRAFALYSDNLIESFASEDPLPQAEFDAMAATPTAASEDQWSSVLAVRDVILLDDGRVGGFVDFEFAGGYRETQYAILVQEGDRWLVDEILLFAPIAATPTP